MMKNRKWIILQLYFIPFVNFSMGGCLKLALFLICIQLSIGRFGRGRPGHVHRRPGYGPVVVGPHHHGHHRHGPHHHHRPVVVGSPHHHHHSRIAFGSVSWTTLFIIGGCLFALFVLACAAGIIIWCCRSQETVVASPMVTATPVMSPGPVVVAAPACPPPVYGGCYGYY